MHSSSQSERQQSSGAAQNTGAQTHCACLKKQGPAVHWSPTHQAYSCRPAPCTGSLPAAMSPVRVPSVAMAPIGVAAMPGDTVERGPSVMQTAAGKCRVPGSYLASPQHCCSPSVLLTSGTQGLAAGTGLSEQRRPGLASMQTAAAVNQVSCTMQLRALLQTVCAHHSNTGAGSWDGQQQQGPVWHFHYLAAMLLPCAHPPWPCPPWPCPPYADTVETSSRQAAAKMSTRLSFMVAGSC